MKDTALVAASAKGDSKDEYRKEGGGGRGKRVGGGINDEATGRIWRGGTKRQADLQHQQGRRGGRGSMTGRK